MDDMTTFERQLADGFKGLMGPSQPVDDAAIFAAISTTRSPSWRFRAMFSATRFVAAAAIVALFGGFAIIGVVSIRQSDQSAPGVASPSPTTTESLLSGLVTEEIEPGVFRVDSDGIRPLSRPMSTAREAHGIHAGMEGTIVAGLDGSVWWFSQDGFFRLGDPDVHAWPDGRQDTFQYEMTTDLEVGPDGALWLARGSEWARGGDISSFDGGAWSVHQELSGAQAVLGVEVLPDGGVWAAWFTEASPGEGSGQVTVARLGLAGWEPLPGEGPRGGSDGDLLVSGAGGGAAWLMPGNLGRERLHRHDGNDWQIVMTPDAGGEMRADAAPDGTLWVGLSSTCGPGTPGNTFDPETGSGESCFGASDLLARFDGKDWEVFDPSDGIPRTGHHYRRFWGFFEAAPDGSVWFDPTVADEELVDSDCDGVANFDGGTVRRYLRGMCIYAMDVAPDGAVWLQGRLPKVDDAKPIDTYVITPVAAAASE